MPKITKRERLEDMYKVISKLQTPEECMQFFEDLCSPAEITAMEQRFAVAELLMQDKVYLDILSKTNASTSTISRVKRVLTDGKGVLRESLEELLAEKEANREAEEK